MLEILLPKIFGRQGEQHTWRLHSYRGIGRIPKGLSAKSDSSKRILLDQLPKILRGYRRTPSIGAVVVVLDSDDRDCIHFLDELKELAKGTDFISGTLFRLAIEEVESWYFGDREALLRAYPRAKKAVLEGYSQDKVCGTWELLADCVHGGGSAAIKRMGWPSPGHLKHQWAENIGPFMELERNVSPSFRKLCEGLRRLVAVE